MRKLALWCATFGVLVLVSLSSAQAQFCPGGVCVPPPPIGCSVGIDCPTPGGGGNSSTGGGSAVDWAKAGAGALTCAVLTEIVVRGSGQRRNAARYFVRMTMCGLVVAVIPVGGIGGGIVGGIFGVAGYEVLFGIDGIVTKTINASWKCRVNDHRSYCAIQAARLRNVIARIVRQRVASVRHRVAPSRSRVATKARYVVAAARYDRYALVY